MVYFSPYYRYFRVNLVRPCPFWKENGQCLYEDCSVCTCEEDEIPRAWISSKDNQDKYTNGEYGWISPNSKSGDGTNHKDFESLDLSPTLHWSSTVSTKNSGSSSSYEYFLLDHFKGSDDDHGTIIYL
jgi:hypothetical protein